MFVFASGMATKTQLLDRYGDRQPKSCSFRTIAHSEFLDNTAIKEQFARPLDPCEGGADACDMASLAQCF